jgi:hypothetical protein
LLTEYHVVIPCYATMLKKDLQAPEGLVANKHVCWVFLM